MNLSFTHRWITLLPLLPLGLCQVRWRSRRTLRRDTLGKKRVLLCLLWVCSGWESLTVFFTSLLSVLLAHRMWTDYEWSKEWLDSCISALAIFIALSWQLGRGELYIPAVVGLVQGSGCGKSPLKNRVVWVEHSFPTSLFKSTLCAWICTGGLCLVCWLSSGTWNVERLAGVGAWTSWVSLCIPRLQQQRFPSKYLHSLSGTAHISGWVVTQEAACGCWEGACLQLHFWRGPGSTACQSMVYGLNLACQSNLFPEQATLSSSPRALTLLLLQKHLNITKTQPLASVSPARLPDTEVFSPTYDALLLWCSKRYSWPSLQLHGLSGSFPLLSRILTVSGPDSASALPQRKVAVPLQLGDVPLGQSEAVSSLLPAVWGQCPSVTAGAEAVVSDQLPAGDWRHGTIWWHERNLSVGLSESSPDSLSQMQTRSFQLFFVSFLFSPLPLPLPSPRFWAPLWLCPPVWCSCLSLAAVTSFTETNLSTSGSFLEHGAISQSGKKH